MQTGDSHTYLVEIKGEPQHQETAGGPQDAVKAVAKKYLHCELETTPVPKGHPQANAITWLMDGGTKSEQWYFCTEKVNTNKNPIIHIMKEAGKKKAAFKIIHKKDEANAKIVISGIPAFLKNNIRTRSKYEGRDSASGNLVYAVELQFICLEGIESIKYWYSFGMGIALPLGLDLKVKNMVLAYEEITPEQAKEKNVPQAPNGKYYNIWWKKNADTTLVEKNGEFFEKPKPVEAQLCTKDYPAFLGNVQDKLKRVNNGWQYNVSWQKEPLFAEDNKGYWVKYGEGDFNYLNVNTESAASYFVVDNNGNIKTNLVKYFKATHK